MAAFPTTVATNSDLYIAVNATSTQLTDNPLSNSATTVNVTDATAFPTVGFISIDNEIIKYTGKTGTSFTGCTRGADGTAATSHVQNSQVFHNVIAAHHNSIKDDLIATEQFISDLIGRTSTQVKAPDGTVSLPGYSFASDPDTGIVRGGANSMSLIAGGASKLAITTTVIEPEVPVSAGTDGTAAAPFFTFSTDPDTGIFRSASNVFDIATGGTSRVSISSSTLTSILQLLSQSGTATAPTYSFSAETGLGIYRSGTSAIGFAFGTVLGADMNFGTGVFDMRNNLNISLSQGSVTAPSLCYRSDTNTGIFFDGTSGRVNFTSDGTEVCRIENGFFRILTGNSMIGGTTSTIQMDNGSASAPSYAFSNDTDTGLYRDSIRLYIGKDLGTGTASYASFRSGTEGMIVFTNGAESWDLSSDFFPVPDNTRKCGKSGQRFTEVWATNGTIQTSHSSTKQGIKDLDWNVLEVPRGVTYERDGRRWIGYLNDSIPDEGRPLTDNGEIAKKDNYEQAVIGVLCAIVKGLREEVNQLKEKVSSN